MKWFLRIVLKDMKLGIGINRILACFNPDAPTNYDNCGNLAKVTIYLIYLSMSVFYTSICSCDNDLLMHYISVFLKRKVCSSFICT